MVENRKGRTSVQKLLIAVPNILYTPEYHMTAVLVDQESSGIWHITAFQKQKGLGWQILPWQCTQQEGRPLKSPSNCLRVLLWLEMRCMPQVRGDEGNADQGHHDSG